MNVLYLDLFNGISGDMLLSAFIHAGFPLNILKESVSCILSEDEFSIEYFSAESENISGGKIKIEEKSESYRDYKAIKNIILSSTLKSDIKKISLSILHKLAEAESYVHNCNIDNVHFHEIGAVDTIIDIVGVASAIDFFEISKIAVSKIPVGRGEIKCAHGVLPNPAPATVFLLKDYNITVTEIESEITTPTGAAIIAGLNAVQQEMLSFSLKRVGYGYGSKKLKEKANFMRILIGEEPYRIPDDSILEIEFNIDDMTGEEIGYFINEAAKKNIIDIQCIPSFTKKNRPGYVFKILTDKMDNHLAAFIFANTSTSGFRISRKERYTMKRTLEKQLGNSMFQIKRMAEDSLNIRKSKIEFDSLKKREN
jgi:uncharacterized protein (TIGR00299 family) protein